MKEVNVYGILKKCQMSFPLFLTRSSAATSKQQAVKVRNDLCHHFWTGQRTRTTPPSSDPREEDQQQQQLRRADLEKVFLLSLYNVDFMNRMIASKLLVTHGFKMRALSWKEHLVETCNLFKESPPPSPFSACYFGKSFLAHIWHGWKGTVKSPMSNPFKKGRRKPLSSPRGSQDDGCDDLYCWLTRKLYGLMEFGEFYYKQFYSHFKPKQSATG